VNFEKTRLAVTLAFASGVSGGLFTEALDRATVVPSTWDPPSFANDLFLVSFVTRCFRVPVAEDTVISSAYLANVLGHPPSDPAAVEHRRKILEELTGAPELRERFEHLYRLLCRFRALLEGATGIARGDMNRRQLDVLQVVKNIVDHLAEGFGTARSGLRALHDFAARIQREEPYRSLSDLLRYDENLATVSLKVGVGADGRIRGFDVLSVDENRENPFVSSPLRRFFAKLELFARGFHFGDGEVMARLIDAVFDGIQDEVVRFVQLAGDVEFYLGALGFRDVARAAGLSVCLPEFVAESEPRVLEGLWNPLLLSVGPGVVPCDLRLDRHDIITLLTGPNSGGKTRLLQSLGLSQLLAQCGGFVPARTARIAPASSLVVSLIQETKVDQAEGRLGMELIRIRNLFERLPPGAMVLLDELCSGTNPSEGEEIFELVVATLARLSPQAFITTHFLAFAGRLERERKIAALRFLQVELGPSKEPTYQFVSGVATTSLAGHAAARLGVSADQLSSLVDRNIAIATRLRRSG
jgi:DNA mismatch repair protein MutS2